MIKILVLDDNKALVSRLVRNITKYKAIPASTISDALEKLKKYSDVAFIAVDYDLGKAKTGLMLYDLLFKSGKSIPAIVFSSKELSESSKTYLRDQGFSKVLSKVDDSQESVSDAIENAADEILADCESRCWQLRKKVEHMGLGDHPIAFCRDIKTIDEWIGLMRSCQIKLEDESKLRNAIAEHCKIYDTSHGSIP